MNHRLFTIDQQVAHCEQLRAVLKAVKADTYDHSVFATHCVANDVRRSLPSCGTTACALGHAAIHGIGGLFLDEVAQPTLIIEGAEFFAERAANIVFGCGAYELVFTGNRRYYWERGDACPDTDSSMPYDFAYPDRGLSGSIELLDTQIDLLRQCQAAQSRDDIERTQALKDMGNLI